jgi:hypothetical protein
MNHFTEADHARLATLFDGVPEYEPRNDQIQRTPYAGYNPEVAEVPNGDAGHVWRELHSGIAKCTACGIEVSDSRGEPCPARASRVDTGKRYLHVALKYAPPAVGARVPGARSLPSVPRGGSLGRAGRVLPARCRRDVARPGVSERGACATPDEDEGDARCVALLRRTWARLSRARGRRRHGRAHGPEPVHRAAVAVASGGLGVAAARPEPRATNRRARAAPRPSPPACTLERSGSSSASGLRRHTACQRGRTHPGRLCTSPCRTMRQCCRTDIRRGGLRATRAGGRPWARGSGSASRAAG